MSYLRAPALLLVLLLVVECGLIAAAAAFAAMSTLRSERWADNADMMASWHEVHRTLALASRLDPFAAGYQAALGQLSERAADQDEERRPYHLQQASNAYTAALELTPSDGVVWARRAGVALAMQNRGQAEDALEKAVALAPWEPAAQLVVASVGVTHWLLLSQTAREQVLIMAGNGLVHSSGFRNREVQRILRDSGFLTMVCDHLTSRGYTSASCAS